MIVNPRPRLSFFLFFFLVQSLPCTLAPWIAKTVTLNLYQLILTLSPAFLPSILPIWFLLPTQGQFSSPLVFYLYFVFSFSDFPSAKAVRAVMFIAGKMDAEGQKARYACLSYSGIHLGNILLTFKQSWHLQAQR